MIQANDYVITESNFLGQTLIDQIDGVEVGYGLVPRDYGAQPVGSIEGSRTFEQLNDELPLIPWAEMPERIAEMVASKSQLSDIRNRGNNGQMIPSLNQGSEGFCWMYSGTSAAMLLRARSGLPHVRLSGHAGGCIIKNFRNQGGWGAQGMEFLMQRGQPSVEFWPERSMARSNDNPRTWENAARHKILEGFIDLDDAVYDRNLSWQQVLTCLLCRIPLTMDFSWWRHSVCGMDAVDVNPSKPATDPNRYGVRIWNSWGDGYGTKGTAVLTGSKARPDGATAPRAIVLAA